MSNWFSNKYKKAKDSFGDLVGSIKKDPVGALASVATMTTSGYNEVLNLGKRTIQDMNDQAAGTARSDIERAQADRRRDSARALNASVKDIDPVALERRRRAAVATNQGRSGTILTGTSLGAADVQRKWLLGQ